MKRDEVIANMTIACFCLAWCIMSYISYDYSHQVDKLEKDKAELQSQLNIKKVELDIAKRDLEEAHDILGVVFLEAMEDTRKCNELKKIKQAGKVKR